MRHCRSLGREIEHIKEAWTDVKLTLLASPIVILTDTVLSLDSAFRHNSVETMRAERYDDVGFFPRSRQSTSSADSPGRPRLHSVHHSLPTLVWPEESSCHHSSPKLGRCLGKHRAYQVRKSFFSVVSITLHDIRDSERWRFSRG